MTIRKGCDSFWMAEILPLKDYNQILDRIFALMNTINKTMQSCEEDIPEK